MRATVRPALLVILAGALSAAAAVPALAGPWSQPRALAQATRSVDLTLSLTATREGSAVAAWALWDHPLGFFYKVQRSVRGLGRSAWSQPATLARTESPAPRPTAVASPDGGVRVSWVPGERFREPTQIVSTTLAPGATHWSPLVTSVPPPTTTPAPDGSGESATSATTPDGTEIAAWASPPAQGRQVVVSTRPPGGAWSPPTVISAPGFAAADTPAPGFPPPALPRIAVDRDGSAIVAFAEQPPHAAPATARVSVVTRLPDGRLGQIQPLNLVGRTLGPPTPVFASRGAALVLWRQGVGGGRSVVAGAARPGAAEAFGPLRELSARTGPNPGVPIAAVNRRGQILVTWIQGPITARSWSPQTGWTAREQVPRVAGLTPYTAGVTFDARGRALMLFAAFGQKGRTSAVLSADRVALPAPALPRSR